MPFFKGLCKRLFSGVCRLGYVSIRDGQRRSIDPSKGFKFARIYSDLGPFRTLGPWTKSQRIEANSRPRFKASI